MKDLSAGLKVALLLIMTTFLYLFSVTFFDMTPGGQDMAKTIVPFLLGSIIGTLMGFYWGNKKKDEEQTPADIAAVDAAKVKAEKVVAEAVKTEPVILMEEPKKEG